MQDILTLSPQGIFKERAVTLTLLTHFVREVRKRVGAHCKDMDPMLYWRQCAIHEISEFAEHYSWEVWKKDKGIDYIHARQEAVDVLVFLIAALRDRHEVITYQNDEKIDFFNPSCSVFHIKGCQCITLSGDVPTRVTKSVWMIIKNIQSEDLELYGQNSIPFIDIVTLLCQLTEMDRELFCATVVAKLSLIYCRLENGSYHEDWNKVTQDGTTETMFLHHIIQDHMGDETSTLEDIMRHVYDRSAKFRY